MNRRARNCSSVPERVLTRLLLSTKRAKSVIHSLRPALCRSITRACRSIPSIYGKEFNGALSLKALTFFEDGDLPSLPDQEQKRLTRAATAVNLKQLPIVAAKFGLNRQDEAQ